MRTRNVTWGTAILLASGLVGLIQCGPPAPRSRLVLIGIDGGSWNLLDPELQAGRLPNLEALAARGVTGRLAAVEPVISPSVWTSIATGRNPKAHGVDNFFAGHRQIRVPTQWERFAAAGLKVGLYDYLVTWPPQELPGGFVIPGWLRRDEAIWPADVFKRIKLPPYAYAVVNSGNLAEVVAGSVRETREKAPRFTRLWHEFDLDLGVVTFYSVDALSHRLYHTVFPQQFSPPPPDAGPFRDTLLRTQQAIDAAVGEIVAQLSPHDHVLIASDHGFRAQAAISRRWGYNCSRLLEAAGFKPEEGRVLVLADWLNAFFKVDHESDLTRLRETLTGVRTLDGRPIFRLEILRAGEERADQPSWLRSMLASAKPAYAFVLAWHLPEALNQAWLDGRLRLGGEVIATEILARPHDFSGDHDPTGIFLAAGPAIAHREDRIGLSVLDLAPLLAYLLGQPITDDLEGTLRDALLDPTYRRRHPPVYAAASAIPTLPRELGDEAPLGTDPEVEKRLRALGYL